MLERVAGALSFDRVNLDLQRVTRDLNDLQRQLSSGRKAADLKGYAGTSGMVISTRTTISLNEARIEAASQFVSRAKAQDTALSGLNEVAKELKLKLTEAATANDGRGLRDTLNLMFNQAATALNFQWGGQYVFGGERTDTRPVSINSVDELPSTPQPFQSATRPQEIDLGDGLRVPAAEPAGSLGTALFDAMRELRQMMGGGNALEANLNVTQRDQLLQIAGQIETARVDITLALGRNGDVIKSAEDAVERLEQRSTMLASSLGDRVDADLAEVAVALSQRQAQYEAIARVIGELRDINLLNYLR